MQPEDLLPMRAYGDKCLVRPNFFADMKLKIRGGNYSKPKLSNLHPKDLIKTHTLERGDLVQVISGKELGKRGKVLEVVKTKNLIVVEGVAEKIKHLKPNPFYPKGARITKETAIHYSNVQLIDPIVDKPVSVELKYVQDPAKKRSVLTRFAKVTGNYIPFKEEDSNVEETPRDTKLEVVNRVTFQPQLDHCPFPASLMNELERMKRRNKEAAAL